MNFMNKLKGSANVYTLQDCIDPHLASGKRMKSAGICGAVEATGCVVDMRDEMGRIQTRIGDEAGRPNNLTRSALERYATADVAPFSRNAAAAYRGLVPSVAQALLRGAAIAYISRRAGPGWFLLVMETRIHEYHYKHRYGLGSACASYSGATRSAVQK
jgi:hypothetical protein